MTWSLDYAQDMCTSKPDETGATAHPRQHTLLDLFNFATLPTELTVHIALSNMCSYFLHSGLLKGQTCSLQPTYLPLQLCNFAVQLCTPIRKFLSLEFLQAVYLLINLGNPAHCSCRVVAEVLTDIDAHMTTSSASLPTGPCTGSHSSNTLF